MFTCKRRIRPEISPRFLSKLGPNPAQTQIRSEKSGPIYNSGPNSRCSCLMGEVDKIRFAAVATSFQRTALLYLALLALTKAAQKPIPTRYT